MTTEEKIFNSHFFVLLIQNSFYHWVLYRSCFQHNAVFLLSDWSLHWSCGVSLAGKALKFDFEGVIVQLRGGRGDWRLERCMENPDCQNSLEQAESPGKLNMIKLVQHLNWFTTDFCLVQLFWQSRFSIHTLQWGAALKHQSLIWHYISCGPATCMGWHSVIAAGQNWEGIAGSPWTPIPDIIITLNVLGEKLWTASFVV